MQSEEQYMERTSDLVAKVRAMRAAAQKEMDRFTHVADYDVRRVVGLAPKASPVSAETVLPPVLEGRPRRSPSKSASRQTLIKPSPAPSEPGDNGETA
jgi:hypothetical protein